MSKVTIDDPRGKDDDASEATTLQVSETRIDDLCKEFLRTPNKPGCIGFLEDDNNREYYIHSVYPPKTPGDHLSLAQLLSRHQSSYIGRLHSRDKYELAVILATSVLQLHSTPWLDREDWREDLRFVRAKEKEAPFAYIRKRFNHAPKQAACNSEPNITFLRRNETIFALGVVLLELSLG